MDSIYIHTAREKLKGIWPSGEIYGKDENLILGEEEAPENSYQTRKPRCVRLSSGLRKQISSPSPASTHNLPRRQKTLQASQRLQPILDTSTEKKKVPFSNDHKCPKLLTAASIVWTFRDQRHQVLAPFPSTM